VGNAAEAFAAASQCTVVGSTASVTASAANTTVLGYGATSAAANDIVLGNTSIATIHAQVTTITAISDVRDKKQIEPLQSAVPFISALKPVSFVWNMRDGGKVGILDTGFIAQDLRDTMITTKYHIPFLIDETDPERLAVGHGKLLPVVIKALQENINENLQLNTQIE